MNVVHEDYYDEIIEDCKTLFLDERDDDDLPYNYYADLYGCNMFGDPY